MSAQVAVILAILITLLLIIASQYPLLKLRNYETRTKLIEYYHQKGYTRNDLISHTVKLTVIQFVILMALTIALYKLLNVPSKIVEQNLAFYGSAVIIALLILIGDLVLWAYGLRSLVTSSIIRYRLKQATNLKQKKGSKWSH